MSTTGKFETREELVNAVRFFYSSGQSQAQVARTCRISEGTVARILGERPKSDKERSAALASRKRSKGLTRVSVWVPRDRAAEIRETARSMRNES